MHLELSQLACAVVLSQITFLYDFDVNLISSISRGEYIIASDSLIVTAVHCLNVTQSSDQTLAVSYFYQVY